MNYKYIMDFVDLVDDVFVPPPEFTQLAEPSSVSLRPDEKKKIELQVKKQCQVWLQCNTIYKYYRRDRCEIYP
jgi:hypothetical protein